MKRIFAIAALTAGLVVLTNGSSANAGGFRTGHGGHGGHGAYSGHAGHHAGNHGYGHGGYGNGGYRSSGYGYGSVQSYRPNYGYGSGYGVPAYGLGYQSGYGGYSPYPSPSTGGVHLGVGRLHLDIGNPHGF